MSVSIDRAISIRRMPGGSSIATAGMLLIIAAIAALLSAFGSRVIREGVDAPSSAAMSRVAGHSNAEREAEMRQAFEEGVAMMNQRQFEKAASAFHRVLVLDARLPEAHLNMGFAFFELGRYAAARDFFRSAIALAPRQANGYYGRALALAKLNEAEAARADLRRFLELASPTDRFREKAATYLDALEGRTPMPKSFDESGIPLNSRRSGQ